MDKHHSDTLKIIFFLDTNYKKCLIELLNNILAEMKLLTSQAETLLDAVEELEKEQS